jgi:GTP-binding protein EngB required for normal cell division
LIGLATAAGRAAEAFDRPLLMAVMGEFNAGKSSFVNALCGAEVAPTGVTPTTATINVLRYGATPEARVVHHDGTSRAVPAGDVAAFLSTLRDADAREVRAVEIFLPVETLRRVEIVDTPGLNSIRPEHERVARDFLRDADAIVWVFAAGQAAKATEREALSLAHAAGKRVVGVLNKIDRAEPGEVNALVRHVEGTLGDLVEPVVPLAATVALAAQQAGRPDPHLGVLTEVLERRFLADARELKRATATAALARFVEAARAAAELPASPDLASARQVLTALALRLTSVLDAERIALPTRISEGYRRAALEVREFVQPRSWPGGEHRAAAADEEFLAELLGDAVAQAAEGTHAALRAGLRPTAEEEADPAATAKVRARVARAIEAALERFAAYARGVIEEGAVPDFFRHQLPRLRLEIGAIRDALVRRAPAPEEPLFLGLRRDLEAAFRDARAELDRAGSDTVMRALIHDERVGQPLEALAAAIGALGG